MEDIILCACGCGASITPRGVNGKPRRYLKGHQCKGRVLSKDETYWELRLQKLQSKAHCCLCGCGEKVIVDMKWLLDRASASCVWLPKYKPDHMPMVFCGCGCGTLVPKVNERNQSRGYVPEHSGRASIGIPRRSTNWESLAASWTESAPVCACGCGIRLRRTAEQMRTSHMRKFSFLPGHNTRRGCITSITVEEQSVVLGSLLGDMSISKPKLNPRLAFTHGPAQIRYAHHKMQVLERFSWWSQEGNTSGFKVNSIGIRGSSACMPILENIWHIVCPDGSNKKVVTSRWLDLLDDRSLAYWFMDDGSTGFSQKRDASGHKTISHVVLHTQGFSLEENHLMKDWFVGQGVLCRVAVYDGYPCLYFPKIGAESLVGRVRPFIHSDLLYKMGQSPVEAVWPV